MDTGVFVLGMHRSGTSAVTRLLGLLGLRTPPEHDLVQPTDKNPRGYWESETLIAFTNRVLAAVECDMRCPIPLEPGWELDSRLASLRKAAPYAVREIFPTTPWVWKDPRHCLAFAFWRSALPVRTVVVLVNRNPLEIAASTLRLRSESKVYTLALWERYLRQALEQAAGLPVLVASYDDVLSAPLEWCERAATFLSNAGVSSRAPRDDDVLSFVDSQLRHARFTRHDLESDEAVTEPQQALFDALEQLEGAHEDFVAPSLPGETPTTEALLAERRRALHAKRAAVRQLELERRSRWWRRARRSRYLAPARSVYVGGRRVIEALPQAGSRSVRSRLRDARDARQPLHVLHVGKTGGTALNHALVEQQAVSCLRLLFRGHDATLADVPVGERFMFVIRDPISRFVSAFNSRLREGRPRYHYPWRAEERIAFSHFSSPNELATALSSDDPAEREHAEQAMRGIGHLNTPYSFWFGDEPSFRARLPDLFFIGFQDRLDEDFELLKRKLELQADVRLPRDPTVAHRTPEGLDERLSAVARKNLERWYARDLAFVQLCRELAPSVNGAR